MNWSGSSSFCTNILNGDVCFSNRLDMLSPGASGLTDSTLPPLDELGEPPLVGDVGEMLTLHGDMMADFAFGEPSTEEVIDTSFFDMMGPL